MSYVLSSKFNFTIVINTQACFALSWVGFTHDVVTFTTVRVEWKKIDCKNYSAAIIFIHCVVTSISRIAKLIFVKVSITLMCI